MMCEVPREWMERIEQKLDSMISSAGASTITVHIDLPKATNAGNFADELRKMAHEFRTYVIV